MKTDSAYIPGVCNIGPAEIRRRQQSGYVGLAVAVVLWAALIVMHSPAAVRLIIFLPTMISASGFIQSYSHFCAGFGMKGVFNFGTAVGQTDTVQQAEFRAKDRRKARQILALSAVIGLVIALAAYIY